MNENLINGRYVNLYNEDGIFNFLFSDPVYDTLKHIHLKSKFRRILIKQLLLFYKNNFLLFCIEYLIGGFFLIFPLILNKYTNFNIVKLYFFSNIIVIIFYLVKNLYKLYDNTKYNYSNIFYWERKNFLSNFGLFLNLILISIIIYSIIPIFNIINDNNFDFPNDIDFISKIIILLFKKNNKTYNINYFKNEEEKDSEKNFFSKLRKVLILLLIFLFFYLFII